MTTHEEKIALLKNSLVKRVQVDQETPQAWSEEVLDAVKKDMQEVLQNWIDATDHEMIGPYDIREMLVRMKEDHP